MYWGIIVFSAVDHITARRRGMAGPIRKAQIRSSSDNYPQKIIINVLAYQKIRSQRLDEYFTIDYGL